MDHRSTIGQSGGPGSGTARRSLDGAIQLYERAGGIPAPVTSPSLPLPHVLHRVFSRYMSEVLLGLRQHVTDDSAVHDLRKLLKRSRAILRLLRDCSGSDVYHVVNGMVRVVAKSLTLTRDAKALIEALGALEIRKGDEIKTERRRLRAYFLRLKEDRIRSLKELKAPSIASFAQATNRLDNALSGSESQLNALGSSLTRIYKKGRQSFSRAQAAPTDLKLHEWRKQAKYLSYALQSLIDVTPGHFAKLQKNADQLAKVLGDDHDLALLRQVVRQSRRRGPFIQAQALKKLVRAIDRCRARLQRRAFRKGRRVYSRKPKLVRKRAHRWIGAQK